MCTDTLTYVAMHSYKPVPRLLLSVAEHRDELDAVGNALRFKVELKLFTIRTPVVVICPYVGTNTGVGAGAGTHARKHACTHTHAQAPAKAHARTRAHTTVQNHIGHGAVGSIEQASVRVSIGRTPDDIGRNERRVGQSLEL